MLMPFRSAAIWIRLNFWLAKSPVIPVTDFRAPMRHPDSGETKSERVETSIRERRRSKRIGARTMTTIFDKYYIKMKSVKPWGFTSINQTDSTCQEETKNIFINNWTWCNDRRARQTALRRLAGCTVWLIAQTAFWGKQLLRFIRAHPSLGFLLGPWAPVLRLAHYVSGNFRFCDLPESRAFFCWSCLQSRGWIENTEKHTAPQIRNVFQSSTDWISANLRSPLDCAQPVTIGCNASLIHVSNTQNGLKWLFKKELIFKSWSSSSSCLHGRHGRHL